MGTDRSWYGHGGSDAAVPFFAEKLDPVVPAQRREPRTVNEHDASHFCPFPTGTIQEKECTTKEADVTR